MELTQFLKKNEGARKVFGQRELKIIEKQLFGVNLTQSEKNRLSRDIRKKFEFIEKVSRFSDEFRLKKGAEIQKLIGDAKETILESEYFSKIKRIFLYGSSVDNERTLRSDIDMAVEFKKIVEKEAGQFRVHVLGRVSDRMDIQVYNVLPGKIKKEIDKKGRVIYEK